MSVRSVVATATVAIACSASIGQAQVAVIDAANLAQNTLTAARTLQELNNQLQQLNNEAKMLVNDARNLALLPFSVVNQLRATLALTTQLVNQAQGLPFQLGQVRSQFLRFYPGVYGTGTPGAFMAADALLRWQNSLESLRTAIEMQAQAAENLSTDENSLAELVSKSQDAIGILQAAQSTNQLLALQSRQLIQDQQLRLTQDRSAAMERARAVVAEARAREVRRRFLEGGSQYSPQPVHFYGY